MAQTSDMPYILAVIGWGVFVIMLISFVGVHIFPPFSVYIWMGVLIGPLWLIIQIKADKNHEDRVKANFRKCPSCGAWLATSARACNSCGTSV